MVAKNERPETAHNWTGLLYEFIDQLTIDSKETGVSKLVPYNAQRMFVENVAAGLEDDIHFFLNLKARQLGITTVSLAIDLFWLFIHGGLQGALVTDTEENRDKFRIILKRYIDSLPKDWRVPVVTNNRNNLVLANGSVLDFLVAGTRKKEALGISKAFNFVHATECSRWGNPQGIANLISSLAESYPDRLYTFESTAHGFNGWWEMWQKAKDDPETMRQFFIGWWAKESYSIPRDDKRFVKYWDGTLNDEELARAELVRTQYDVEITPEQIAWYRWYEATRSSDEGVMTENYPWHEDEAFLMSGVSFFPNKKLDDTFKEVKGNLFRGFRYHLGEHFAATQVEQVFTAKEADLRIWEEPDPAGFYVIGGDPAFGRNDWKDRSAIEVYRGYADRLVQVAEYASSAPETYQTAWVLCHLAGIYKQAIINLEVTGPGFAVMQEMKNLKWQMQRGFLKPEIEGNGFFDIFNHVKWYLYHRPDSMGAGYVYNWKTTADNKMTIFNQFRDSFATNIVKINSLPMIAEMRQVVQSGSTIEAEGRGKDDRVFASALAHKAWMEWLRNSLMAANRTFERVKEERRKQELNPVMNFASHVVESFFRGQDIARRKAKIAAAWNNRRY